VCALSWTATERWWKKMFHGPAIHKRPISYTFQRLRKYGLSEAGYGGNALLNKKSALLATLPQ